MRIVLLFICLNFQLSTIYSQSSLTFKLDSLCQDTDLISEQFCTRVEALKSGRITLKEFGLYNDSLKSTYERTNFDNYITLSKVGLQVWTLTDSINGVCRSCNTIARGNYFSENLLEAFDYSYKALHLAKRHNLKSCLEWSYSNFAWIYFRIGDSEQAVKYIKNITPDSITSGYQRSRYYNALGVFYRKIDEDSSFYYFEKGLAHAEEDHQKALILSNMAAYLRENKRAPEALNHMRWVLRVNQRENNLEQYGGNLVIIAKLFAKLNRPDSAISYLEKSLEVTESINDRRRSLHAYQDMVYLHDKLGNKQKAIDAAKAFIKLNKDIFYPKHLSNIVKSDWQRRDELNKNRISSLEAEKVFNERDLKRQRTITTLAILIGLLLLGVFGVIMKIIVERKEREEQIKNEILSRELIESEMKSLKAQMNPHFLFNTLNSIKLFIIKNEARLAADYLAKFAQLMRLTLQYSNEKWIAVSEEIRLLDLYMTMECLRLKQPFTWRFVGGDHPEVRNIKIPPMVLQPFVENAIWHGLSPRDEEGGQIEIHFDIESQQVRCRVIDNGIGREASLKMGKKGLRESMGLKITNNRLSLIGKIYQQRCEAQIHDLTDPNGEASGTEVETYLPIKN